MHGVSIVLLTRPCRSRFRDLHSISADTFSGIRPTLPCHTSSCGGVCCRLPRCNHDVSLWTGWAGRERRANGRPSCLEYHVHHTPGDPSPQSTLLLCLFLLEYKNAASWCTYLHHVQTAGIVIYSVPRGSCTISQRCAGTVGCANVDTMM